jgi:hypothetical protein
MENALLYTFSTIAQALGGAFALLAAFVLYRFEVLSKIMYPIPDHLRNEIAVASGGNFQWYDTLNVQGRLTELIERVDKIFADYGGTVPILNETSAGRYADLKNADKLRAFLSRRFKVAAVTTGGVMFYTVAAIPFAHVVYCMWAVSVLLLAIGIIGFGASLWLYWTVIRAALFGEQKKSGGMKRA